jgi:hypothetical protein
MNLFEGSCSVVETEKRIFMAAMAHTPFYPAALSCLADVVLCLSELSRSSSRGNASSPPCCVGYYWASSDAKGFNEIISGSNPSCGTSGFSATKGWNPVSTSLRFIATLRRCLRFARPGNGPRDTRLPEVTGDLLEGLAYSTLWTIGSLCSLVVPRNGMEAHNSLCRSKGSLI